MIQVLIKKEYESYRAITIEGHSNFAKKGSDIVCAGVSAIGVGGLNALNELTSQKPHYQISDGYLYIEFLDTNDYQIIAKVIEIQLKSIEENYKRYIKITYGR